MNSRLQFHNWQILFTFALCAAAALANAADPDDQIYETSPDERFGFRDSFAGAAKTEQSEMSDPLAIDVVEISSKRVVLRSPKEALTPIHLRREPQAWSSDWVNPYTLYVVSPGSAFAAPSAFIHFPLEVAPKRYPLWTSTIG